MTETTDEVERPAGDVIEALSRVMRDLPGIGRTETSEQGYQYRGIEQITRHAQALFARHGVVFAPRVVAQTEVDLTINGRPWTEQRLLVEYDVYGPGGVDDKITVGPIASQGRDNSDKGSNKALTQAYKYALLQTLCIGDAKDDADAGVAHEADARREDDPVLVARRDTSARIKALGPEARNEVREWMDAEGIPRTVGKWTEEMLDRLGDRLDLYEAASGSAAPTGPGGAPGAGDGESGAVAAVCACGQVAVGVFDGESLCEDHAPAEATS